MSDLAAIEIVELNGAAAESDAGMIVKGRFETTGIQPSAPPVGSRNDTVTRCLDQVHRLLKETPRGFPAETSPHTIFRIPPPVRGIDPKAEEPEIVSIGPYHRGRPQVLAFEELKPLFLTRFLRRTRSDLGVLTRLVAGEESSARTCYSEHVDMMSADFVQMMLLDVDPIFERPQIIPALMRDLVKLENQIPYSLLRLLFNGVVPPNLKAATGSLAILAMKLFDLAYPRPMALLKSYEDLECEHLLDLFYKSLSPTGRIHPNSRRESWSSAQSIPSVTELRPSGIKFKSNKADSLLDISFRRRVLQIPNIAINDFMTTVLINSVSLEQCRENRSRYMTDYVSFMHCLVNQPKDVSLLRSYGIIALFSHDNQYVADLFNKLGKSISFNVRDCFLSRQFKELESYYCSQRANAMRTYSSSPWSSLSAFSAFLVLFLTFTQTFIALNSFQCNHPHH
ncbi:hypothetical protein EUGRSUZ_C02763 [Eucalyptus grandis]|uniref:Uncharacterized protein n=2 Tax=Eucalyptus grandis TaxID=71139 RepID=A0A059CTW9_EUCGR|nr:hypothetical protein EUGRSUZ_C02763 [Eucalyptus grandis]